MEDRSSSLDSGVNSVRVISGLEPIMSVSVGLRVAITEKC